MQATYPLFVVWCVGVQYLEECWHNNPFCKNRERSLLDVKHGCVFLIWIKTQMLAFFHIYVIHMQSSKHWMVQTAVDPYMIPPVHVTLTHFWCHRRVQSESTPPHPQFFKVTVISALTVQIFVAGGGGCGCACVCFGVCVCGGGGIYNIFFFCTIVRT